MADSAGIINQMVEQPVLDSVFRALSDPTRRAMLEELSRGERTVTQLAQPFDMSLAGASKHVKALEAAGLIRREVIGRRHVCSLEAQPVQTAAEWLLGWSRFWNDRLD